MQYTYYVQDRRLMSTETGHPAISPRQHPLIFFGEYPEFTFQFPEGVMLQGDILRLALDIDRDFAETAPMAISTIVLEEAATAVTMKLWTRTTRFKAVINGHRAIPSCLQLIRYRMESIANEQQRVATVILDDIAFASSPVSDYGDDLDILPKTVTIPVPSSDDSGKVVGVNSSGEYALVNNEGGGSTPGPAQVQADWDESDSESPAFINNKPDIPAGGGGTSALTEVITSAASLTAEQGKSYYWNVGAQDATLSAQIIADVGYDIPIDISINGGTVTLSGITRVGTFINGFIHRCLITKRYDETLLYIYRVEDIE